MISAPATFATVSSNPHVAAFCDATGPEIFRSVAYPTEVWMPDPLDVASIHAAARDRFDELINKATSDDPTKVGRVQLMLGESGSGKTHLMRSLRTRTHRRADGYFGFMQMTSLSGNYGRYVLQRLIDSLDKTYYSDWSSPNETTALMRISTALAESLLADPKQIERLRESDLPHRMPAEIALAMTDRIAEDPRLHDVNPDLITALILLQCNQNAVRKRVIKYLRAESLSDHDRQHLGGLTPIDQDHDAIEMIVRIGKLVWAIDHSAIVICIDQLEDIWDTTAGDLNPAKRFRNATTTLLQIASRLPNAVVVIACLEDFYDSVRTELASPVLDRIEREYPLPLTLASDRTEEEARQIAQVHLQYLFDHVDVRKPADEPTYPIPESLFEQLRDKRTRDLLADLRSFRDQCIKVGEIVDFALRVEVPNPVPTTTRLEMLWNECLSEGTNLPPDEDEELAALLDSAIDMVSVELPGGNRFESDHNECDVSVRTHGDSLGEKRLLLRICNRGAQGGALGKRLQELLDLSSDDTARPIAMLIRSTDYKPTSAKTKIAKLMADLVRRGGKKAIVSDSDWRAMAAMQAFHSRHGDDPDYLAWRQHSCPLSRLKSLRDLLAIEELGEQVESGATEIRPSDEEITPTTSPVVDAEPNKTIDGERTKDESTPKVSLKPPFGKLRVGTSRGRSATEALLDVQMLQRHTGILGSSGSGKTTAALNLVEQLLCQNVPVLLVDRKGDLASYAKPSAFDQPSQDPRMDERRRELRNWCEVVVYTPGQVDGRSISLPIAPAGMKSMTTNDRQTAAGQSAQALGAMLGYSNRGANGKRIAVLNQAIELLGRMDDRRVTLESLIDYISEQDDDLIASIGLIDPRVFRVLLEDLQTLKITRKLLFETESTPLDGDTLFGINGGQTSGSSKTRLSIINLAFLGGEENCLFWVSQLLMELSRWMKRQPSGELRGVVMFDEADLYLPAVGKPPTKEPMEDLLKRARSAGLGMMLATQSPGDLDYKCRDNINTWLLGKIAEENAIKKMKSLLEECRRNVRSELASQNVGEFFLVSGGDVIPVHSDQSVVETDQLGQEEILQLAAR